MAQDNGAPSTALVMAGGGALGAYEVGVALYTLGTLPKELDRPIKFNIFSGTSIGALNASFLAAMTDNPSCAICDLASYWRSMTFDKILRFGFSEIYTLIKLIMGRGPVSARLDRRLPRPPNTPHHPVAGVFDTSELHEDMKRLIPWDRLQENLETGSLRGLALCATEVCTGMSIVFYQAGQGVTYRPGRDPSREAREVKIGVEHAMASAAVPFLFPAVQINGTCYMDGALHQNTPLNPAMRLGAERLLVISLTQEPHMAYRIARLGCRRNPYLSALFLLGKTINILMTQSLDHELGRVQMYNKLIEEGCKAFGDRFLDELNRIMGDYRNATYRKVKAHHIRPSQNLHYMALEALRNAPRELALPGVPGKFLATFMNSNALVESDLLSFLMFTPTYIRNLIDLGYHDARMNRDSLIWLFDED